MTPEQEKLIEGLKDIAQEVQLFPHELPEPEWAETAKAAIAELERLIEATRERPMSEAPRDGTKIQAYNTRDKEWQEIAWMNKLQAEGSSFWFVGPEFEFWCPESRYSSWRPLPYGGNAP